MRHDVRSRQSNQLPSLRGSSLRGSSGAFAAEYRAVR